MITWEQPQRLVDLVLQGITLQNTLAKESHVTEYVYVIAYYRLYYQQQKQKPIADCVMALCVCSAVTVS